MLSQWMYFWDWDGAAPVVSVSATATVSLSLDLSVPLVGGGQQSKRKNDDYVPFPDEYWDIRGLALRADPPKPSVHSTPRPEATPAQTARMASLKELRTVLSQKLSQAPDLDSMKAMADRIKQLDASLGSFRENYN